MDTEITSTMPYRLQLVDLDSGTSTAAYFALSKRMADKGFCIAPGMKGAACDGILMRGQERGWLEAHFYDMLAHAARGRPDWQLAISMIARGAPDPLTAEGSTEGFR